MHEKEMIYASPETIPRNDNQIMFNDGHTTKLVELKLIFPIELFRVKSLSSSPAPESGEKSEYVEYSVVDFRRLSQRLAAKDNEGNQICGQSEVSEFMEMIAEELKNLDLSSLLGLISRLIDKGLNSRAQEKLNDLEKLAKGVEKQYGAIAKLINYLAENEVLSSDQLGPGFKEQVEKIIELNNSMLTSVKNYESKRAEVSKRLLPAQ